jgi:hypothetical protein
LQRALWCYTYPLHFSFLFFLLRNHLPSLLLLCLCSLYYFWPLGRGYSPGDSDEAARTLAQGSQDWLLAALGTKYE